MATDEPKKSKADIEDEVDAAFDAEFGHSWLDDQPMPVQIVVNILKVCLVLTALYFFLVALSIMGSAFQAIAGTTSGELFTGVDKPIVGLMIGILATVLVQSSSTTTSIIVVLVAADLISVSNAIPMIMGANIGTSVTNTIVSLGFVDDTEAYRRGFSGATVHDMFNYLNVATLLPVELIVSALRGSNGGGPLESIAVAIAPAEIEVNEGAKDFDKEKDFLKEITSKIKDRVISINKDVISDYAQGRPSEEDCVDGFEGYSFNSKVDVTIVVDDEELTFAPKDDSPFVYCNPDNTADATNLTIAQEVFDAGVLIKGGFLEGPGDAAGGIIGLVMSLSMLILALLVIVKTLTSIVKGPARFVLVKALNYDFVGGGYLSILVGVGITVFVQSSSITTSILTPLVAVGTLSLENMYPFTLGANIGTTATGLIAALGTGKATGLEIALVHFFFNVFGVLIWYPAPFMRKVPIAAARFLGNMAAIMKWFPIGYIIIVFLLYPAIFFGISSGFNGSTGGKVVAALVLILFLIAHAFAVYWYLKMDGKAKIVEFIEKRNERLAALKEERASKEDGVVASDL